MGGLYDNKMIATLERGVRHVLDQWELPSTTRVELLTISENATFLAKVAEDGQQVVLRVHRPGYHTRAEIESELAWIKALREEGIVETPEPLTRTQGGHIATFEMNGKTRPVVAFSFMSGVEPSPTDQLSEGFYRLGAINARLHEHARRWRRPSDFVRKVWDFDTTVGPTPHWGDWREALGLQQDGRQLLERTCELLQARLADYGTAPERFGLIHADLRLANLLMEGERLGVIDFDDCGFGWFGYDFAAAISFFEDDPNIPALQDAWVRGYRTVATLPEEDEAMLPTFIMLRRLLLTAWIASHSETPTAQEMGTAYTDGTLALAERFLTEE